MEQNITQNNLAGNILSYLSGNGYHEGARLPSERALAENFSVSRRMIRSALDQLQDTGIIEAVSPRIRQITTLWPTFKPLSGALIGLITKFNFESKIEPDYKWEDSYVICRAAQKLQHHGASILFLDPQNAKEQLTLMRLNVGFSALVISSRDFVRTIDEQTAALLKTEKYPLFMSGTCDQVCCDKVVSDHEQGAYKEYMWLAAAGCKNIKFFSFFTLDSYWMEERFEGYKRAARELGRTVVEPVVFNLKLNYSTKNHDECQNTVKNIANAMQSHLEDGTDAIMTPLDRDTYLFSSACRLLGKVPNKDILLAGYDNSWEYAVEREFEEIGPLITCDKKKDELADSLGELILQRLCHRCSGAPQIVKIAPQLIQLEHHRG